MICLLTVFSSFSIISRYYYEYTFAFAIIYYGPAIWSTSLVHRLCFRVSGVDSRIRTGTRSKLFEHMHIAER
jgi:hypothetical protein